LSISHEHPLRDRDVAVVVIDESGSEVHREQAYPEFVDPKAPSPSAISRWLLISLNHEGLAFGDKLQGRR
jgi:hypothetical protein